MGSEGHTTERRVTNYSCVICEADGQRHRNLVKKGLAEPKQNVDGPRKKAINAGERFYFTGKPCPRGHISKRSVNGGCIECYPFHAKTDYEKHKTKRNEANRRNAYKYVEQRKQYDLKNKEYLRQKTKEYNQKAEVKERNKVRWKEYWSENRERRREIANKYARSSKGLVKLRARQEQVKNATPNWACYDRIETKYKERIAMTRLTGVEHHVDHIIPLQGKNVCGLHIPANLRVIPARDNLRKHNRFE